ncbi:MAG: hypothetical protein U9Q40_08630 [Campylobacterota bacterium]|nr:hypothetical protein [Campylobacterota bacterium]
MRRNLGNIFILFLLFFTLNLSASTYEWSASINKKSAFVNEAILLTYICKFSDRSELYTIDFNPVVENEDYVIKALSEQEQIVEGKRVNTFEYIAYVKRSGEMIFDFDMIMKKTNEDSIENTVLGRDNEQYEEFTSTYLRQKSLHVDIKRSEADLVGEFTFEVKLGERELKAYEPFSLEFIIKGVGNFEKLKALSFKIDGVKVFSQKALLQSSLKEDGEHGLWSQKFAFVSDKDFVIQGFEIEYFDVNKALRQLLRFDGVEVKVTPVYKKVELLDEEVESFEFKSEYLYYLLTLILGFIIAKIDFSKSKKPKSESEQFCLKVQHSKSLGELSMLLAIADKRRYERVILKIEKGELTSLKEAKRLICD